MLTSVNASDVNNTAQLENNIIHVTSNGSHIESNTTLNSGNNLTQTTTNNKHFMTKNSISTKKTLNTTKKLKQESTKGYVYVNSKGTGDGSDSSTPTNITTALTKVTNGGTIYLITDDDNDTYYYNKSLNINSRTIPYKVTSFNITAQPGKTIIFQANNSNILDIDDGYTVNINGITFGYAKSTNGAITSKGNLTVTNSIFINNTAKNNGGAICLEYGKLTSINNTFINNSAGYGGAVYVGLSNANTSIINNIFINNRATEGGVIFVSHSNIIMDNNTFTNNKARNVGGVISSDKSNATIINNKFNNNSANYGGAIDLTHSYNGAYTYYSTNKVSNNTFTNNKATYGGAIYSFGTDDRIDNNLFINNTATINGGAILNSISNQTIKNNNFTDNQAKQGEAICTISGTQNVINNTFTNNMAMNNSNFIYSNYTNITLLDNTLPSNTTIIRGIFEGDNDRTVYNQRDVVPSNTTEKNYTEEDMPKNSSKIVYAKKDGQPIPFSDNSTSFCIEPKSKVPIANAVYEREVITNQAVYNPRMPWNVIEHIKAFLVLFWNDTEAFEDPFDLNTNRVVIEFLTSSNYFDRTTLAFTPKGLKKPLGYFLTTIEKRIKQGDIPNRGLLSDNKTTYQLYYYKALDDYNGGVHYQNMIGITLNKTPLKKSWAWKLTNETTIENVTETYTVNVTQQEPYNTTEEYQENITVEVPYNATETYNVNVTKQVPYNRTETYNVNVTKQVPYNRTETYNVNVTKQVPYNVTKKYNVTIVKPVRHNTTHKNTQHKTIKPDHIIKTNGIGKNTKINNKHIIKTNTNTRTVASHRNITKQETRTKTVTKYRNVTVQESRTRIVTKYRNVTVQEPRTRTVTAYKNVTVQEPRTRTVTKYQNVTKTVTKTRLVTKYHEVTRQEQRSRTVTKTNYHYKLHVYLLYLEGKISYKDLISMIGTENLQFDENGNIVLDFDNMDNVPSNITVTGLDNNAIPTTSDNVDTSNPDGLGDQIIDAGIITTEL
jgi:predicted outer membrane repeat protein